MQALFDFVRQILFTIRPWFIVRPWEKGVRVRLGKRWRTITPGVWLSIPFVDSFHVHDVKPQIANLPNQSLQTRDGVLLAVSGAVYYGIDDVKLLYVAAQDWDDSLANLAMGEIARHVATSNVVDCNHDQIVRVVRRRLRAECGKWGLDIIDFYLTDLVPSRTYRLMTGA